MRNLFYSQQISVTRFCWRIYNNSQISIFYTVISAALGYSQSVNLVSSLCRSLTYGKDGFSSDAATSQKREIMGNKILWDVQVPTNPALWWMFSCRCLHQLSQGKFGPLVSHAGCGCYWNLCRRLFCLFSKCLFPSDVEQLCHFFSVEIWGLAWYTTQKLVHVVNCGLAVHK